MASLTGSNKILQSCSYILKITSLFQQRNIKVSRLYSLGTRPAGTVGTAELHI